MKLRILVTAVTLYVAATVVTLYWMQQKLSVSYKENHELLFALKEIEALESRINAELFENSFYLYFNYDELNRLTHQIRQRRDYLLLNAHLEEEHPHVYKIFKEYNSALEQKLDDLLDYQSYNSAVKNSLTYLSALVKQTGSAFSFQSQQEQNYFRQLTSLVATVYQTKNSMDCDLLYHFDDKLKALKAFHFTDPRQDQLSQQFILHLTYFRENFSHYSRFHKKVTEATTTIIIEKVMSLHRQQSHHEVELMERRLKVLFGLFLFSLAIILLLALRMRQQHRKMITDQLTGAYNRGEFDRALLDHITTAHNEGSPLSLLMLDIDHFKRINDTFGHQVGDETLQSFVDVIKSQLRSSDKLFRYGGEEFAVVLEKGSLKNAVATAERIRSAVDEHFFDTIQNLSTSIGVAQLQKGEDAQTLFKRTDSYLYGAKQSGRNCVVSEEMPPRKNGVADGNV